MKETSLFSNQSEGTIASPAPLDSSQPTHSVEGDAFSIDANTFTCVLNLESFNASS